MTAVQKFWLAALIGRIWIPRSKATASQWCEEFLRFREPKCTGPFSLSGREYLREPLDNWGSLEVTDQAAVMGTRTGKTRILYGGIAYTVANDNVRVLFVKPKTKGTAGAEDDAKNRFIPMLRASKPLAALIPSGPRRHDFKTAQQIIGGSIVDWTGSNSVGALASNPCSVVVQDETDKFNTTRKRDEEGNVMEADASALADERCKEFSNPKRFKASTPTLLNGLIWQELLKSDLRRYFVPCPHCKKFIVFAWSKEFTLLPKTGSEAYVHWDSAAKDGGKWDFDAVEASAHAVCPHCQGQIRDTHKAEMVRSGEWRPTQKGLPNYRGYHLPSMYAAHRQCNFGKMAVRFLKSVNNLDGPRGFINSDLAEPYAAQDISTKRVEKVMQIEVLAEWKKIMSVDCQAKSPHFWFVIRAYGGKEIIGLKGGPLETWDDVRSVQLASGVPDAGVIVDSGYGAKDDAEVYRTCADYGEQIEDGVIAKIVHIGWMPAKGMPGNRTWRDKETGLYLPYYYRPIDPYIGLRDAGNHSIEVFEFASDYFKDILQSLRNPRDPANAKYRWSIHADLDTDEYHLHMRGEVKDDLKSPGRPKWRIRHRYAKNHMFDCETMQVAAANAFGLLEIQEPKKEEKK